MGNRRAHYTTRAQREEVENPPENICSEYSPVASELAMHSDASDQSLTTIPLIARGTGAVMQVEALQSMDI